MAGPNGRTPEQVRRDIETERTRLADAVDELRSEMDVNAKLQDKLPVAAIGRSVRGSSSPAASARRCGCSCAAAARVAKRPESGPSR